MVCLSSNVTIKNEIVYNFRPSINAVSAKDYHDFLIVRKFSFILERRESSLLDFFC